MRITAISTVTQPLEIAIIALSRQPLSCLLSRWTSLWTRIGQRTRRKSTNNNTLVLLLNEWNEARWLAERTQWNMDTQV